MAPRKQPTPMKRSALLVCATNLVRICAAIEREYGNFEQYECQRKVREVQAFLFNYLPLALIESISNCKERMFGYGLVDHRIIIYLLSHPRTTSLSFPMMVNRGIMNEKFWMNQLYNFKYLVALDLKLMCTDEILRVVGDRCPLLEVINCISKTSKQVNCSSFNALRLQLYVSDEGLLQLTKCKKLKQVIMNRKICSNCAGRIFTLDGVRSLITSLPDLRKITFENLGPILEQEMCNPEPLALEYIHDSDPTPANIANIAVKCPKLKQLMLRFPNVGNFTNDTLPELNDVAQALCHKNLQLEVLALDGVPITQSFFNLLQIKGSRLTCLEIHPVLHYLHTEHLLLIGESCPNLTRLYIYNLRHEDDPVIVKPKPLFKHLTHLWLVGKRWDPFVILPICLNAASLISELLISNDAYSVKLDPIFQKLMETNILEHLKVIKFGEGCLLSKETFRNIVTFCPLLTRVAYVAETIHSNVFRICDEFERNNYDFTVELLNKL